MDRRSCLSLVFTVAASACYPMLSHEPRVEPGVSIVLHNGLHFHRGPSDSLRPRRHRVIPAMGFQVAMGFRSADSDGPAIRLAGGLNVLALAALGDIYLESPRAFLGEVDAGLGIGAQFGDQMAMLPYFTLGHRIGEESSWFTTHAVGATRFPGDNWHTVWLPTLAIGTPYRARRIHVFATGVIGGADCPKIVCWDSLRGRPFFLFGVASEVRPPRIARRLPEVSR